jgi:hypothetical protein
MGMGEFSATVNREFQNSARVAGLVDTEEVARQTEAGKREAEKKAEEEKKNSKWHFRRAEDRQTTDENNKK